MSAAVLEPDFHTLPKATVAVEKMKAPPALEIQPAGRTPSTAYTALLRKPQLPATVLPRRND